MRHVVPTVFANQTCQSRQRHCAGCLVLALLVSLNATRAADPPHYRIVSAKKVEELESQLRKVAARGYRLVGSGGDQVADAQLRGRIHLLLESLPEPAAPPEYLVFTKSSTPKGLKALQEAGDRGLRISDHGVIERMRNWSVWPLPETGDMQTVLVMERSDPAARWEYALERFPRKPGTWPALASRIAEGYRLLAVTKMEGAILARREGAERVEGIKQDRFKVISSLKKKNLAVKLDASAEMGFRIVALLFSVTRGGSYDLLLEQTAEPGRGYEYRLLRRGKTTFAVMNELGAEGFRPHRAAWWIMERKLDARNPHEYSVPEIEYIDQLNQVMKGKATEGYRLYDFASPNHILLERPKPAVASGTPTQ